MFTYACACGAAVWTRHLAEKREIGEKGCWSFYFEVDPFSGLIHITVLHLVDMGIEIN